MTEITCSKLTKNLVFSLIIFFYFTGFQLSARQVSFIPPDEVAARFKALLSRPSANLKPSFQSFQTDSVLVEKGFIYSEASEKVPVLIYKPVSASVKSFPVVICLHGTGGRKDQGDIKNFMYKFSQMGIMAVSIDARFHGERVKGGATGSNEYVSAITAAWKNTDKANQSRPFLFDTVYDLWKLTDYLSGRSDVQANRIGMMGISMGGIQTWMAASVDKRIKVMVPIIAAQSFKWSLENDRWQGRAGTIRASHLEAAKDMGDSTLNRLNVKALWDKLVPGITEEFDCPSMIRLCAPRPLLLLSSEKDQNCPLPGAQIAFKSAEKAYNEMNVAEKFSYYVAPNEPHRLVPKHVEMTVNWFVKWL